MITSKDNKLIKYLISIKDKKQSRTDLVCLIETIKIVRQMLDKNMVTHIFCVEEKIGLFKDVNIPIDIISNSIAKYFHYNQYLILFLYCRNRLGQYLQGVQLPQS